MSLWCHCAITVSLYTGASLSLDSPLSPLLHAPLSETGADVPARTLLMVGRPFTTLTHVLAVEYMATVQREHDIRCQMYLGIWLYSIVDERYHLQWQYKLPRSAPSGLTVVDLPGLYVYEGRVVGLHVGNEVTACNCSGVALGGQVGVHSQATIQPGISVLGEERLWIQDIPEPVTVGHTLRYSDTGMSWFNHRMPLRTVEKGKWN